VKPPNTPRPKKGTTAARVARRKRRPTRTVTEAAEVKLVIVVSPVESANVVSE